MKENNCSESSLKYFCDTYQTFAEPYDDMNFPNRTIFVILQARNEIEARKIARNYRPKFCDNVAAYSCTSNSQYPLKELSMSRLNALFCFARKNYDCKIEAIPLLSTNELERLIKEYCRDSGD